MRLPIDAGMVSFNWLVEKSISVRFTRLPTDTGILPVSWFCAKFKKVSAVRLPMVSGIVPFSLLFTNDNVVTLLFVTPTPLHLFTGCVLSQLVLFRQFAPLVLLYKSTSASESLMFICAFRKLHANRKFIKKKMRRICVFIYGSVCRNIIHN